MPAPVFAQENTQTIRVDASACRYVTKHVPDADVAYKPGVNVHGKKVVPADVAPPTDYHVEDSLYLRLTLDAAKAFGLKVPKIPTVTPGNNPNVPAVTGETVAGYITFKHGKAYLNNQPLDHAGERQLAVLCSNQKPQ
ncbi:MAG: hypothetical protein SFW65_04315 [Alphaproteobacteria bacterium]|nr:hypothetical protein [Alphaproteobacteria bacterium]